MALYDILPWKRHDTARTGDSVPLLDLQKEFNKLFDAFFEKEHAPFDVTESMGTYVPRMNVEETDDAYTLSAELPGMSENDISVEVSGSRLTVSGEKKEEKNEKKKGTCVYRERHYGRFERTIPLDDDINRDGITAEYKKGILTVILPKTEKANSERKRIAVKAE